MTDKNVQPYVHDLNVPIKAIVDPRKRDRVTGYRMDTSKESGASLVQSMRYLEIQAAALGRSSKLEKQEAAAIGRRAYSGLLHLQGQCTADWQVEMNDYAFKTQVDAILNPMGGSKANVGVPRGFHPAMDRGYIAVRYVPAMRCRVGTLSGC
jgi:hypothetical protein